MFNALPARFRPCGKAEFVDITAQYGERVRTQHIARVLLLSTIVFVLTGCQVFSPVGEFFSQRYTNTASYFNTYYNAQKMFGDAENEVLADIETGRQKSAKGQTVSYTISSTARQKFTASIEKNSKLLTYYPTSKFVDDALIMIGKAYFYLGDDVKAERKFLELISQYPNSNLIPETKLWLGKSLLRQKKTAEGVQQLEQLYSQAKDDGKDDVAGSAALALGAYYFEQEDYQNALKYYTQSLESLGDGVENARTQFQIGQCYNRLGDYAAAQAAFHKVQRFKPDYNTTFQAALYESRMLTQQKKFEPALSLLFDKLDDGKYVDYAGTAHREVGNIYAAQGNVVEAVAQYRFVDTAYAHTDDAARSMFALASLYENVLLRYDSARVYYDKARTEYSASEITPAAALRAESFTKYFSLKHDLGFYDTLITDIKRPGWRKKDSLTMAREDSIHRVDSTTTAQKIRKFSAAIPSERRDTSARMADSSSAAAAQHDTSSDRLHPRLMHAGPSQLSAYSDSVARVDSTVRQMKALEERQKLDSLSRTIIRTKFELAGLLYLEMNRTDSALVYFTDVVKATTDSLLAARSYFTMAAIYQTGDSVSRSTVDSLYRKIIVIAPNSSYAQEARKNLGMAVQVEDKDSSEVRYLNAEQMLDDGKPDRAIPIFRSVTDAFPKSIYAPKALFTVGWIYENTLLNNDSAAAAYQQLATSYPYSSYATSIKPKLAEIGVARHEAEVKAQAEKEEKDRIEKAAKAKADSTAEQQKLLEKLNSGTHSIPDSASVRPAQDSSKAGVHGDSLKTPMPRLDPKKNAVPNNSVMPPKQDTTNVTLPNNPAGLPNRDTVNVTVPKNPPMLPNQDTTKPAVPRDSVLIRPQRDQTKSALQDSLQRMR
jgi:TolA-binding protein